MAPKVDFLTVFGLVVTLTFDLLTSKSNQFISVPKCTKVVNLVKSREQFIRYICVRKLQDACTVWSASARRSKNFSSRTVFFDTRQVALACWHNELS